jgi:EmrB/QacA subfamily drug resistance transporter
MLTSTRKPAPAVLDRPVASPAQPAQPASPWRALPILMAGTFMIVLDFFIVNVAMSSMQSGLHASTGALEWVVAGYGLTFSVLLVTAGRLGDQIGRRRMLMAGLALFTLTSAACGVAPNAPVLVLARLAQGVAAAAIAPTVLSFLGVLFTGPDRVRAISIYGMVLGLGAAGGQLVGGVLIQGNLAGLGWRSVFLINVPIGLAAVALAPRLLPESRPGAGQHLDLAGTALLTAGLTGLILPLVEGRQLGWPDWTWACLAVSPVILLGFARHQRGLARSGGNPMLHPDLWANRALRTGLLTQIGLWCGQASFFLVLALYLQMGRGLDALQSGLVFTILAGPYLVASQRASALTARFGRTLVGVGALTLAAGHVSLLIAVHAIGTGGSVWAMVPGLALVGTGMGLCITPLTSTVLAQAEPRTAGAVTGALSTMQQVGNSLGVAVTGVIFFGAVHHGHGYAPAFTTSVAELAGLLVLVAWCSRLLPAPLREKMV